MSDSLIVAIVGSLITSACTFFLMGVTGYFIFREKVIRAMADRPTREEMTINILRH